MKRRICVHCGREYVASDHPHSNVCSEKCRRERALQRNREYKRSHMHVRCTICGKRIPGRGLYCEECKATHAKTADPVSLNFIRKAKKCPKRCSWTRWKMELSRRRLERDLGALYENLPDPDRLM